MLTAFVLVNTKIDSDNNVLKAFKEISNVKEVHQLYGSFDLIAKVETGTVSELNEIVMGKINQLESVRSTRTMITM